MCLFLFVLSFYYGLTFQLFEFCGFYLQIVLFKSLPERDKRKYLCGLHSESHRLSGELVWIVSHHLPAWLSAVQHTLSRKKVLSCSWILQLTLVFFFLNHYETNINTSINNTKGHSLFSDIFSAHCINICSMISCVFWGCFGCKPSFLISFFKIWGNMMKLIGHVLESAANLSVIQFLQLFTILFILRCKKKWTGFPLIIYRYNSTAN